MIFATPEELGEVKAETAEERAERAERVLTAALAGLAALIQNLCGPAGKQKAAPVHSEGDAPSNGTPPATDSLGQPHASIFQKSSHLSMSFSKSARAFQC